MKPCTAWHSLPSVFIMQRLQAIDLNVFILAYSIYPSKWISVKLHKISSSVCQSRTVTLKLLLLDPGLQGCRNNLLELLGLKKRKKKNTFQSGSNPPHLGIWCVFYSRISPPPAQHRNKALFQLLRSVETEASRTNYWVFCSPLSPSLTDLLHIHVYAHVDSTRSSSRGHVRRHLHRGLQTQALDFNEITLKYGTDKWLLKLERIKNWPLLNTESNFLQLESCVFCSWNHLCRQQPHISSFSLPYSWNCLDVCLAYRPV